MSDTREESSGNGAGFEDIHTDQAPTDLPVLSHSVSHASHTHPPHGHEKPRIIDEEAETVSTTSSAEEEAVKYPEGGREAWSVVFGSLVSLTASFGIMNSIGTLHAHLVSHQLSGYSEGKIGWIFGMYSFLSFFGGIVIGKYLPR
jgi:hypothetical protein